MQKPLSLNDWLKTLETRHPREIDLGLDRIGRVAKRLGIAKPAPQVISVAGTNGKGSCVALMQALLIGMGYRVGAYTSPHLLHYNERIQINGESVSDQAICRAFERIDAARGEDSLTYFEFGTLAAFLIMLDAKVDIALLEVGLGGRLDAVNLVDADVAVITSVDMDHMDWLGADRDSIGMEKAGIARPGQPVVVADPEPPPAMMRHLSAMSVRILAINDGFRLSSEGGGYRLECRTNDGPPMAYSALPEPAVPLFSAVCAVQALLALGVVPQQSLVREVFAQTAVAGRFQHLLYRGRQVILDVAHNPAAAELLADRLAQKHTRPKSVQAVFAVMADKDISGIARPLAPLVGHWHLPGLDIPRSLKPADLMVYNLGSPATTYESVGKALKAAYDAAEGNDLILVFGSFYTVAEAMKLILEENAADE